MQFSKLNVIGSNSESSGFKENSKNNFKRSWGYFLKDGNKNESEMKKMFKEILKGF